VDTLQCTAKESSLPGNLSDANLAAHDVALDIKYSGICHSDIHQAREEWGPAIFLWFRVTKSQALSTQVGLQLLNLKLAIASVLAFSLIHAACAFLQERITQQYCIEGMTGTYNQLERDGKTPAMGGYSNVMVINEDYAVTIPANLSLDGVAPLLCAGITLYSPIKHWKAGPGKKVAVMGLGGLGHMGVKFAAATWC
jgi:alcohol dehydrogenase (NADP+)